MTGTLSSTALAWLLTYAIHSTVLLSLAWILVRVRRWSPGASELLWKSAMLGAILTASVQLRLDVRPAGTVMLQPAAVTTPATTPAVDRLARSARSGSRHPHCSRTESVGEAVEGIDLNVEILCRGHRVGARRPRPWLELRRATADSGRTARRPTDSARRPAARNVDPAR